MMLRRVLAFGLLTLAATGAQAAAPCSPFTSFPLVLNFGTGPNTGTGEDYNCAMRKVQAAVNTLPSLGGVAGGFATLGTDGKVLSAQLPSGAGGSLTGPLLTLRPTAGGQNLAVDALGSIDGYVPYWNGSGTTLNRVDSDGTGAIGQGRIFAPEVHRWTDRLDNGTSDGSANDPYHQPSNGLNTVSMQLLQHTVGGGTGVRETQRINTIFDTPSKPWNVNNNYVASRRRVSILTPDGGVPKQTGQVSPFAGAKGAFFTDNPEAFAGPAATDLLELAISEANIGIRAGGSARILYGYSVVKVSDKQGDVIDAAFSTGAGGGSTPFKDQILFSDAHGGNPLDPNGSILRVGQFNGTTLTVGTIFDFSALSSVTSIMKAPLVDWRPSVFALTSGTMTMIIPGLPTSDPHVAGQWYRDTNLFIKMSGG